MRDDRRDITPKVDCTDRRLTPMMLLLLACIQKQFEDCGIETCFLGMQAGAIPDLTYVGDDGAMAWVRLDNVSVIVDSASGPIRCSSRLAAQIEVGYSACYAMEEEGDAPTAVESLEIVTDVNEAMMALMRAILCCEQWAGTNRNSIDLSQWEPMGPEGGVVGGTWLVTVEF